MFHVKCTYFRYFRIFDLYLDSYNSIVSDCKDTKIWMIARHGTRLPSAKDIVGMNTTLKDLKFEILLAHQQGKGVGNISLLLMTMSIYKYIDTYIYVYNGFTMNNN